MPERREEFALPNDVVEQASIDTLRNVKIEITPSELVDLMKDADQALNGDSNDEEHDALYRIRRWMSEVVEDPDRRVRR